MKRIATFTLTSSYQRLSVLADAFTGNPLQGTRSFTDGAFRCASLSTDDVRVSIVPSGGTASDDASVLLGQGEYLSFDQIDIANVWAKAVATAGTLELEGNDEYRYR